MSLDHQLAVEDRINRVLESWAGTPYRPYTRIKGRGADCREFVVGVLDELYRRAEPTKLDLVAQDLSTHQPNLAFRFYRAMLKHFPHERPPVSPAGEILIESGDVLIHRVGRGPGHVALVGVRPYELWHASFTAGRVCPIGLGGAPEIVDAWRPIHKESWA